MIFIIISFNLSFSRHIVRSRESRNKRWENEWRISEGSWWATCNINYFSPCARCFFRHTNDTSSHGPYSRRLIDRRQATWRCLLRMRVSALIRYFFCFFIFFLLFFGTKSVENDLRVFPMAFRSVQNGSVSVTIGKVNPAMAMNVAYRRGVTQFAYHWHQRFVVA